MNFFYSRLALIITAIVCCVAFAVFEQFAFRVKLVGVEGEERTEVARYLKTHKIKSGMPKSKARKSDVAVELVEAFPFLAHANLSVQGSTVVVTVMRADVAVYNTEEIVACADGVIADIIVFSGEALVGNGDVVRKGDVLVTGNRPTAIVKITNGAELICMINNTEINQSMK